MGAAFLENTASLTPDIIDKLDLVDSNKWFWEGPYLYLTVAAKACTTQQSQTQIFNGRWCGVWH